MGVLTSALLNVCATGDHLFVFNMAAGCGAPLQHLITEEDRCTHYSLDLKLIRKRYHIIKIL